MQQSVMSEEIQGQTSIGIFAGYFSGSLSTAEDTVNTGQEHPLGNGLWQVFVGAQFQPMDDIFVTIHPG